jgi:hypothetical protein
MTPHQFAAAVGAELKWVQNAARLLGRRFRRVPSEARWLRLVRLFHDGFGIALKPAAELASDALAMAPATSGDVAAAADYSARIAVDLSRVDSSFAAALASALAFHGPKQRGRSRWGKARRGVAALKAAEEHGVDLSLLHESLALTPDQRLRRLDENAAFIRALRRR